MIMSVFNVRDDSSWEPSTGGPRGVLAQHDRAVVNQAVMRALAVTAGAVLLALLLGLIAGVGADYAVADGGPPRRRPPPWVCARSRRW